MSFQKSEASGKIAMLKVKLTCNADIPEYPFIRQTPGRTGIWGNCEFLVNTPLIECDWWVVLDDLPKQESVRCSPSNTIFFNGEPSSVKVYDKRFLHQFATVVTSQQVKHPHVIQTQQSLFWSHQYLTSRDPPDSEIARRGYKDYDEINLSGKLEKSGLISLITSDKAFTLGHRQRLEFALRLKEQMGDELDFYLSTRGKRELDDKWKITAPYKYHIAIENSSYPDYWTEKLADPLLFDSYPFYYGCPNIFDYFPQDALTLIDILDFDRSLATIRSGIKANLYEKSFQSRQEAKGLILNKYNLFPAVAALINQAPPARPQETVVLKPHSVFQQTCLSRSKQTLARLGKGFKH